MHYGLTSLTQPKQHSMARAHGPEKEKVASGYRRTLLCDYESPPFTFTLPRSNQQYRHGLDRSKRNTINLVEDFAIFLPQCWINGSMDEE
jgi:hypothetical protein